jgi:hypothetical protein
MILGGIVNRKDFNLFSLQLATCQSKKWQKWSFRVNTNHCTTTARASAIVSARISHSPRIMLQLQCSSSKYTCKSFNSSSNRLHAILFSLAFNYRCWQRQWSQVQLLESSFFRRDQTIRQGKNTVIVFMEELPYYETQSKNQTSKIGQESMTCICWPTALNWCIKGTAPSGSWNSRYVLRIPFGARETQFLERNSFCLLRCEPFRREVDHSYTKEPASILYSSKLESVQLHQRLTYLCIMNA